ncbi:MAG: LuxR C-terminal-related transcriptional regulator [Planctomycetota bacterium]
MSIESAGGRAVISVAQAARVVTALNQVASTDGPTADGEEKVRVLLRELQTLLGYEADLETILYEDLGRKPVPKIARRVWYGPTFEEIEPRDDAAVQDAADAGAGMWDIFRAKLKQNRPSPCVAVYSEDHGGGGWFETMREQFLVPHGWADILCAGWIDRRDRLVQFIVLRKETYPPFGPAERELMELMVCAVAPLIDREMFRDETPETFGGLSPRQTDVLRHLLTGMSEKEVARALHRSVETVHNHVRAIYQRFEVNSRGELMAKFIDRRVLEGVGDVG